MQSRIGNQETTQLVRAKLEIGRADDAHEREADRLADRVMSMPAGATETARLPASPATAHRRCEACAAGKPCEAGGAATETHADAPSGGGRPLSATLRSFFEPRFGHDFGHVRIHTDAGAAESARAIGAEAYASGRDVVFGPGKYRPSTFEGKKLIAHELAHVAQHDAAGPSADAVVRRKATIAGTCTGHDRAINAAWDEAVEMVDKTIETLQAMMGIMRGGDAPSRVMKRATQMVQNTFGDVGGLDGGGFTRLNVVIEKFNAIKSAFDTGRTIRCDPESLGKEFAEEQCSFHAAFVVVGNATDIFLCPGFLASDVSQTSRATTLIHEMAHSALRAGHEGLREGTFPATAFNCNEPMGLDFDDAKKNAFAYGDLANCLHGERPGSEVTPTAPAPKPPTKAPRRDLRWTGSLLGGAELQGLQGLAGLASRVSLRTGSAVVFNPTLGLQVLYSPRTDLQPEELFYGILDAGLRIQKPVKGVFLDLNAGFYGGFETNAEGTREGTGGFAVGGGVGWRSERIEVGVDSRALLPFTKDDPTRVVVLGRFGVRFGK